MYTLVIGLTIFNRKYHYLEHYTKFSKAMIAYQHTLKQGHKDNIRMFKTVNSWSKGHFLFGCYE